MRVHVICGFLGSGKTTLLQRILTERAGKEPLAVIVNEFGEVGVDGAILAGQNIDMVELTAGCLCCTLKGSLVGALEELRDKKGVERVVIEATGVAQPGELAEVLRDPALAGSLSVGPMVTVVDTAKFGALRRVLGPFYSAQVSRADVLLLNKTDLATRDQLEQVRREVGTLSPRAIVVPTQRCNVALETILGEEKRALEPSALELGLASPAPAASFVSFVIPAEFETDRKRVEAFFADLPPEIMRAKGFMRIDHETWTVQYAAGQLELTPAAHPRSLSIVVISSSEPDRTRIIEAFRRMGSA